MYISEIAQAAFIEEGYLWNAGGESAWKMHFWLYSRWDKMCFESQSRDPTQLRNFEFNSEFLSFFSLYSRLLANFLSHLGNSMFVLNGYFCCELKFFAILSSKLRFLLRNTGVYSDFTQNFWGKIWQVGTLCQRIKVQWKKRSKLSHLLTVRAEVAGGWPPTPPLTVSLTKLSASSSRLRSS